MLRQSHDESSSARNGSGATVSHPLGEVISVSVDHSSAKDARSRGRAEMAYDKYFSRCLLIALKMRCFFDLL